MDVTFAWGDTLKRRVTFAWFDNFSQGLFCTSVTLAQGTLFHDVTFARKVNFAQKIFCTGWIKFLFFVIRFNCFNIFFYFFVLHFVNSFYKILISYFIYYISPKPLPTVRNCFFLLNLFLVNLIFYFSNFNF